MQKWINFMKVNIKYSRTLWNLKKIFQYSQKYNPKGHLVMLFSDVTKNSFYDENCLLQNKKKWHRCGSAEIGGSGLKIGFRFLLSWTTFDIYLIFDVSLCSAVLEWSLLNQEFVSSPPPYSQKPFFLQHWNCFVLFGMNHILLCTHKSVRGVWKVNVHCKCLQGFTGVHKFFLQYQGKRAVKNHRGERLYMLLKIPWIITDCRKTM